MSARCEHAKVRKRLIAAGLPEESADKLLKDFPLVESEHNFGICKQLEWLPSRHPYKASLLVAALQCNLSAPSAATAAPQPPPFPRLKWGTMRLLGNIQFLKVSYVVLVAVPLLVLLQHKLDLPWEGLKNVPTILKLTYFSSLFLACAHMVYQGFCPSEIKRFDSPNDLYHDLLRIKTMERRSGGDDPAFSFDYDHCLNGFDSANVEFWFARLLCWVFYTAGIVLFGVVIVIQALRVLGVFLL